MAQGNASRLYLAAVFCLGAASLAGCSADEPAPEPTSASQVNVSADQLQKILEDFSQEDASAKVISDKKLRSTIPKAQEWLENAKVNPSKCGVTFAEPVADQLQNSTMGAVESQNNYITVAIYKDSQLLDKQWDAKASANDQCSRYSVTTGNESRAYHLAKQPMDSVADKNESYVVTSSDGKTTQQQLVTRSASSNVLVSVQGTTSNGQTQEQVKEATAKIDELFNKLNG